VRLTRISLAIYLVALAIRLTLIFGFHRYEIGRPEAVRVAISLATHGSFADPHDTPTGPTAHVAPIYPLFLAPIYAVLGDTRAADFARMALSAAVASAEYALLPWVAQSLGIGLLPGILAGAAGTLVPWHFWPECMGDFEVSWVAVFLELSVIFFARFLASPALKVASALRAGLWCGLGLLLSPGLLPVLLGLLALAIWRLRKPLLPWAALASAAALLTISPWLVRNYLQLGGLFFVRDSLGLELYVSNHDRAVPDVEETLQGPFYQAAHPHANPAAALEIGQRGELAFNRERLRRALDWIGHHPREFLLLSAARVRNFWFPPLRHPLHRYALWSLNLLALAGLVLLVRGNRWAALVVASLLLTFPVPYYFVYNYLRYQHPIYWVLLLLAGCLGSVVWSAARVRYSPRTTPIT
jgi:hypothetical protein